MAFSLQEAQQQADEVAEILATGTWHSNLSYLKILENFVEVQVQYPPVYSISCNLAILKEYLIFRRQFKIDVVQRILAKALMHLPETDFDMCLCQIPLSYQEQDPLIEALIHSEKLLQTCKFPELWDYLKSNNQLSSTILEFPDFKDSLRRFMAGVISLTYSTIKVDDVAQLLKLTPESLSNFCQQHLRGRWTCNLAENLVTISKDSETAAILCQAARPLFSSDLLAESLGALRTMSKNVAEV